MTGTDPEADTLIAEATTLLARGDLDALTAVLPGLEPLTPASEAQWRQLRDIFARLGRSAWVEIVTRRFLQVEPSNLNARLDATLDLSSTLNRGQDALLELRALLDLPYETAEQFFKLGAICMKCSKPELASHWFQKAREADPDNADLRSRLFWSFVFLPDLAQARTELAAIRPLSEGNQTQLIVLSEAALQTGDVALAVEAFEAAAALARSEGRAVPGLFLLQAIRLDRTQDTLELAETIDLASFGIAGLESTFKLLEGRGMAELERRVVAAALALEPGNVAFQTRARAQGGRAIGLFAPAAPVPGPSDTHTARPARGWRQAFRLWR